VPWWEGIDAEEVARQLTLYEWEIFRKIEPWELLDCAWTKNEEERAPNVITLVRRFDEVKHWIISTICHHDVENSVKQVKVLEYVLDVAEVFLHTHLNIYLFFFCQYFKRLGNLNGVMEIMSSLRSIQIYRLKGGFSGIGKRHEEVYEELIALSDPAKSRENIRACLQTLYPPCLPYLNVFLEDLIFCEGSDSEGEMIDFGKMRNISRIIGQIKSYQIVSYNLELVPSIQEKIEKEIIISKSTDFF